VQSLAFLITLLLLEKTRTALKHPLEPTMAKNLNKRPAASLFDDDEEEVMGNGSAIHHAKLMAAKAAKVKSNKEATAAKKKGNKSPNPAPQKKPASGGKGKVKFVPPPAQQDSDSEESCEEERKRRRKKSAAQVYAHGRQAAESGNTRLARVTHNRRVREIRDEIGLEVTIPKTQTKTDPSTGKQKKRVIHEKVRGPDDKVVLDKDGNPKLKPVMHSVPPKMTEDAKMMLQLSVEEQFNRLSEAAINSMVASKRSTISPMNVLAAAEQLGIVDKALVYPSVVSLNSHEYDPTKNRAIRLKEKKVEAEGAPENITQTEDYRLRIQPARDALRPFKYMRTKEENWSDLQSHQAQEEEDDDEDDEEFDGEGEEEDYDSDKEMEDEEDEEDEEEDDE